MIDHLWPWWLGGAVIGALVPLLYYLCNVGLGVSTGFGSLIKAALPGTRLGWLNSPTFRDRWGWRLFFMLGLVLGAALANHLAGGPAITVQMGVLTSSSLSQPLVAALLMAGGFMLGLGARLAGGCTSGHSIHGMATLQVSGLAVTVGFLLFGALTANLLRIVVLSGVGS